MYGRCLKLALGSGRACSASIRSSLDFNGYWHRRPSPYRVLLWVHPGGLGYHAPQHTHTAALGHAAGRYIKGAVCEGSWSRVPRPCVSGSRQPRQHLHLLGAEKKSPGSFLAGPRWQPLWNAIENSISQPNPRASFQCKNIYQINPTR